MEKQSIPSRLLLKIIRNGTAILCAALLAFGETPLLAQSQQATSSTQNRATKIPPDQLDSLVAPIALYPDPMLAQTLAASTYPLEIIQLQQWLEKNKNLKDKALADAVAKQSWDPSIQAMAALPDVVKRLADDIQWTTDLGQRVSGAAERCDGCRAAHAQEGPGQRQFEIDRATEGGNQSHRKQECDRRRTGQSASRVCAFV